jgi:hypothetical protein
MAIQFQFTSPSGNCGPTSCGPCPTDRCPDFTIRRHDTRPEFKVAVQDCDGPLDIQGLVVEVNMWTVAKLKKSITATDTYFSLADNGSFDQIMEGDVVVMNRARNPEYMLVTGFDEDNKLVQVERGYRATTPSSWKKGNGMRIFRIMNAPAQTETHFEDIKEPDGSVEENTLIASFLVYQWSPQDTCLPGCYWLEFKIIKMQDLVLFLPGGHWGGPVTQNDNGIFYTGSAITGSSAPLSYDSVHDRYLLPSTPWDGDFHLYSGDYYTGTDHDDGAVYLDRTAVAADPTVVFNASITNAHALESNLYENELASNHGGNDYDTINAHYSGIGHEGNPNSVQYLQCGPSMASIVPSFTSTDIASVAQHYGCLLGEGVEWIRRMPVDGEGFLIRITDSPTVEGI